MSALSRRLQKLERRVRSFRDVRDLSTRELLRLFWKDCGWEGPVPTSIQGVTDEQWAQIRQVGSEVAD